ncbi:hypothetical protein PoB_006944700 [Plakobranchus ocellatus]|uniref:Uncharacterized protein n=1 Tax=Plakobranchus ocellatus TaxID=259542 RepID=A0AAV4DFA4_9GAST|nr:hypothetical protein PoB_006944700 [Plakobranchus ocellatus]
MWCLVVVGRGGRNVVLSGGGWVEEEEMWCLAVVEQGYSRFEALLQARAPVAGSNPRQKILRRSQGELVIRFATKGPELVEERRRRRRRRRRRGGRGVEEEE